MKYIENLIFITEVIQIKSQCYQRLSAERSNGKTNAKTDDNINSVKSNYPQNHESSTDTEDVKSFESEIEMKINPKEEVKIDVNLAYMVNNEYIRLPSDGNDTDKLKIFDNILYELKELLSHSYFRYTMVIKENS